MTADRGGDAVEEVNDWLEDSWDPDLTLGEWWERMGMAGWSNPLLPADAYGRGISRGEGIRVQRAIASFGAVGAPALAWSEGPEPREPAAAAGSSPTSVFKPRSRKSSTCRSCGPTR